MDLINKKNVVIDKLVSKLIDFKIKLKIDLNSDELEYLFECGEKGYFIDDLEINIWMSNDFKENILCPCSKKHIRSTHFSKHCNTEKHKYYLFFAVYWLETS